MRGPVLIAASILALSLGCTRAEIVDRDAAGGLDAAARDAGVDGATPRDAGPPADAGCGYAPVNTDGQPAGCTLRLPPGRPMCDMGASGPSRLYAVRSFRLQVEDNEGYDVDGYCTAGGTGPAACGADGSHPRDGEEGIDNQFGKAFIGDFASIYAFTFMSTLEIDINTALERGNQNIALQVLDYNGLDDDPEVTLVFANSVCGRPAGAGATCPGRPSTTPLDWTVDDNVFHLDEDDFVNGQLDEPAIVDIGAYVSARQLVGRLATTATFAYTTDNGTVYVSLGDGTIVADISMDGRTLDGIITGSWGRASAIAAGGAFGLCPPLPAYDTYVANVDAALDAAASGESQPTCDAMSAAIGFTAVIAQVGPAALPGPPDAPGCP